MRLSLAVIGLLVVPVLSARAQFHSYNTLQLLRGGGTLSASLHSVNGYAKGRFFGGLGTGLDFYRQTTVPIFAEGRLRLTGRRPLLQVYGNLGLHLPVGSGPLTSGTEGSLRPGWLWGGGLDYAVTIRGKQQALLGIGYGRKQFAQEVTRFVWNPATGRTAPRSSRDQYRFDRLWIRIGWVW